MSNLKCLFPAEWVLGSDCSRPDVFDGENWRRARRMCLSGAASPSHRTCPTDSGHTHTTLLCALSFASTLYACKTQKCNISEQEPIFTRIRIRKQIKANISKWHRMRSANQKAQKVSGAWEEWRAGPSLRGRPDSACDRARARCMWGRVCTLWSSPFSSSL